MRPRRTTVGAFEIDVFSDWRLTEEPQNDAAALTRNCGKVAVTVHNLGVELVHAPSIRGRLEAASDRVLLGSMNGSYGSNGRRQAEPVVHWQPPGDVYARTILYDPQEDCVHDQVATRVGSTYATILVKVSTAAEPVALQELVFVLRRLRVRGGLVSTSIRIDDAVRVFRETIGPQLAAEIPELLLSAQTGGDVVSSGDDRRGSVQAAELDYPPLRIDAGYMLDYPDPGQVSILVFACWPSSRLHSVVAEVVRAKSPTELSREAQAIRRHVEAYLLGPYIAGHRARPRPDLYLVVCIDEADEQVAWFSVQAKDIARLTRDYGKDVFDFCQRHQGWLPNRRSPSGCDALAAAERSMSQGQLDDALSHLASVNAPVEPPIMVALTCAALELGRQNRRSGRIPASSEAFRRALEFVERSSVESKRLLPLIEDELKKNEVIAASPPQWAPLLLRPDEVDPTVPLNDRQVVDALSIHNRLLGPTHEGTISWTVEAARRQGRSGRPEMGLKMLQDAALVVRDTRAPEGPPYASLLFELAACSMAQGEPGSAAQLAAESARIFDATPGWSRWDLVSALALEGDALLENFEFRSGLQRYERAWQVANEIAHFSESTAELAQTLSSIYESMDRLALALHYQRQAHGIYSALGSDFVLAHGICSLQIARLIGMSGDFRQARPFAHEGLKAIERADGPIEAARAYVEVADLVANEQHTERTWAEALGRIFNWAVDTDDSAGLIEILPQVAEAARQSRKTHWLRPRVARLLEAVLEDGSEELRGVINGPLLLLAFDAVSTDKVLASVAAGNESPDDVVALGRAQSAYRRGQVAEAFLIAAEGLQAAFARPRAAFAEPGLHAWTTEVADRLRGILFAALEELPDPFDERAYAAVATGKGLLFESELRVHGARQRSEAARLFEEHDHLSGMLRRAMGQRDNVSEHQFDAQIKMLTERRSLIEGEIARYVSETPGAAFVDIDALRASLGPDDAVVDFYKYAVPDGGPDEHAVFAFVVRPGSVVRAVDYGSSEQLEAAIERWRAAVLDDAERSEVDGCTRAVLAQLWEPLIDAVAGATRIYWCPEGAIGRLPIGSLRDSIEGTALVDRRAFVWMGTPRDVLSTRRPGPSQPTPSCLLLGDVDYDSASNHHATTASPRPSVQYGASRAGNEHFGRLPATADEVNDVETLFRASFVDGQVDRLTARHASVAGLRDAAAGKTYLHLATHAFWAGPVSSDAWASGGAMRAGLVLAGVNSAEDNPFFDDGMMTANELGQLDLTACRLVTLSGCVTTLGTEVPGEGFFGLARAARVAGAEATLSSLWEVPDDQTRYFMKRYYEYLWAQSRCPADALREAQLDAMHDAVPGIHSMRGWAGWVLSGRPV